MPNPQDAPVPLSERSIALRDVLALLDELDEAAGKQRDAVGTGGFSDRIDQEDREYANGIQTGLAWVRNGLKDRFPE